jgi:hypothetical protein
VVVLGLVRVVDVATVDFLRVLFSCVEVVLMFVEFWTVVHGTDLLVVLYLKEVVLIM